MSAIYYNLLSVVLLIIWCIVYLFTFEFRFSAISRKGPSNSTKKKHPDQRVSKRGEGGLRKRSAGGRASGDDAGGRVRGPRSQGGRRFKGHQKRPTSEKLDDALERYMMRDPSYAKNKLDSALDSYMMDVEQTTTTVVGSPPSQAGGSVDMVQQ